MPEILKGKTYCYELIKKYYNDNNVMLQYEALKNEISLNLSSNAKMLDAGCGHDAIVISEYSDFVKEAVGVDLVKEFKVKPNIKTYTADLQSLPFVDNYFDLIISRNVCEHLKDPLLAFKELKRVLKPRGKIVVTTPNKYCYSSIISSLLPTSFKTVLIKKIFGRDAYDNFPVFYRCNTKSRVKKIVNECGLALDKFRGIRNCPHYLMFSVLLFKLGVLYDKFITFMRMDYLQASFLFVLSKKD